MKIIKKSLVEASTSPFPVHRGTGVGGEVTLGQPWLAPASQPPHSGRPKGTAELEFSSQTMSHLDYTILPPPCSQPGSLFLEKEGKTERSYCSWSPWTSADVVRHNPPLMPLLWIRAPSLKGQFYFGFLLSLIIIKNYFRKKFMQHQLSLKISITKIYNIETFCVFCFRLQTPVTFQMLIFFIQQLCV